MTPKQERFIAEYLVDLNATQAAIRAGYSPKTAQVQGARLLSNAIVASAISEGKAKQLKKVNVTGERILEELARLALGDAREFYDEQGNLKPPTEWTPEMGARVAGMEVIIKNAQAGDGQTDVVHKIRIWEKTKALDTLAKHFGLLVEKIEHQGGITVRWATEDDPVK